MSLIDKYYNQMADFRDYRTGTFRNKKNGIETHTFNGVLQNDGLRLKDQGDLFIIPDNTSFALGRENFTMFFQNTSLDYSGTHHLYAAYGTAALPRFIFRNTSSRLDFTWVSSDGTGSTLIGLGAGLGVSGEKYSLCVTFDFTANIAKIYYNGLYVTETSLATTTGNFSLVTGNQIGPGVGRTADMNELTEYCGLIKGVALTAAEVAEITSELNAGIPEQKADSQIYDNTGKSYGFNGSSSFAALSSALNLRYDQDWEIEFCWECEGLGTERTLLGSTIETTSYLFSFRSANNTVWFFDGIAAVSLSFTFDFIENILYKIHSIHDPITGFLTVTLTNLSTNKSEVSTIDLGAMSATWSVPVDLIGKRGNNDRYFQGDISRLKITIDGTETRFFDSDYGELTPTDITVKGPFEIIDYNFKGELHALANERTISSGFLENTGIQVKTGAHKLISETNNSSIHRVIQCASAGAMTLPATNLNNCSLNFHINPTVTPYISISSENAPWFTSGNQGYLFTLSKSGIIRLWRHNGGSTPLLFEKSMTIDDRYYKVKIVNNGGTFSIYVDDVLLSADSGSNPVTDTTYTDMKYITFDLDAGDKIIWSSKSGIYDFYQKAEI
jgi:hypothetical protein